MIKTLGIYKSFGNVDVIKGIDLQIDRGEIVTIVGASGAGKSSLINALLNSPKKPTKVMYSLTIRMSAR